MIRLTWRQFRLQALVGLGLLIAFGIVLLVTGPHLLGTYDSYLALCAKTSSCGGTPSITPYQFLQEAFPGIILLVPALLGIFWGAPLIAREIETGTYRLAWTQSITRTKWLTFKLGGIALATMAAVGLLSWWITWWFSPVDRSLPNQFSLGQFSERGIVPIGYAAFALAFAIAAGVIIRRTVPAMGLTIAGFIGARLATTFWIRSHLIPPITGSYSLNPASLGSGVAFTQIPTASGSVAMVSAQPNIPDGWIYSSTIVDKSGQALTPGQFAHICPALVKSLNAPPGAGGPPLKGLGRGGGVNLLKPMMRCVHTLSAQYHVVATYQPSSRYWPLQFAETGLFLAAAAVLAGVTFWWTRHRLA